MISARRPSAVDLHAYNSPAAASCITARKRCLICSSKRLSEANQSLASIEHGTAGDYPLLAIAVDGPTGPARQPKAGAIRIAADFGYRLLPISVNGDPKTVLKNRWDRHEVPLPFARVRIAVGDPVDIPRDIVPEDLPEWQALLRERIEAADPASLKFS